MKVLLFFLALPFFAWSQCSVNAPVLHNTGDVSTILDNRTKGCNAFALTWAAQTGVTALSIALEGSDDNSTYTAFPSAAVAVGVNPGVTLSGALVIQASTTTAYLRVHAITVTGTGSVLFQLYGFSGVQPSAKAGGGGGGGGGIVTQSWTAGGSIAAGALVCPSSGVTPVAAITCPLTVVGINPLMINRSIIGIAQTSATIGNAVSVIVQGPATCAFDSVNAPTAGHLATYSLGTAGSCQDSGTGGATLGVPIAGVVVTTGAVNTTQSIYMFGSGNFGSGLATVAPLHLNNPATGNQFAIQLGNITGGQVGTGTKFMSATGTFTGGDCLEVDPATGSIIDAMVACGFTLPASVVQNNQANTGTAAFTLDASAAAGLNAVRVPVQAGVTATANGAIAYDPTNNNLHAAQNGADAKLASFTVNPGNGNCVEWLNTGGRYDLGDTGAPCGTGGSGGAGITVYSSSAVTLGGTQYFTIGGGAAPSTLETFVWAPSPSGATISHLQVRISAPLGIGNFTTFTWRDNAVSQSLSCTISGAAQVNCGDTSDSFNVAAGDLLSIRAVTVGTVIGTPAVVVTSAFGTSSVGVTSVFGNSGPAVGATGDIGATGAVVGVNGAAVPAAAHGVSTNSSKQVVASTAHDTAVPLTCAAASSSTTAYACSTTPTFVPAAGDLILFCPDLANTAAATLVVNSQSGTPAIQKQQGQAALVANDLRPAPACVTMEFNATNWVMQGQTGNAAGGGSGPSVTSGVFASLPGTCTTNDLYFFTDSLYTNARCSATNTWIYFADGKQAFPPSAATWTNVNFTNCSTSDTNGYRVMTIPTNASSAQNYQTTPVSSSGGYTHYFAFRLFPSIYNGIQRQAGVFLTDGTKIVFFEIVTIVSTGPQQEMVADSCTNQAGTAGCADVTGPATIQPFGSWAYFRVDDNVSVAGNITMSYSTDGETWRLFYSGSRTAVCASGCNAIGWGAGVNSTQPTTVILVSYQ